MNKRRNLLIAAAIAFSVYVAGSFAEPSENFKVFLCFGQSNMSGGMGVNPENEDKVTNPRIFTIGFGDCQGWQNGKWGVAKEPLHCGDNINAMGPAFAFGRVMADSLPEDTIGLIPCGLYGVALEMFMKGKTASKNGPIPGNTANNNAYDWMMNRCKTAMERGVFSGIVMHQGESNNGDGLAYLSKVKKIYNDLKTDLKIEADFPYVAGELRQDQTAVDKNGNNPKFNDALSHLLDTLPFGYVASSKDLGEYNGDQWLLHFNQKGYREMGKRMAIEMLKGLRDVAKTAIVKPDRRVISSASVNIASENIQIFTLDGRTVVSTVRHRAMKPGNIYVVFNKTTGASTRLMMAPAGR